MEFRERFDVIVVGSGPVGSTFARVIKDLAPETTVLLVESGPLIAVPPGRHVATIADPEARERAQVASQGPNQWGQRAFGAADGAHAIAAGEPFPLTARPGTWLLGEGSVQPGEDGMPAAALSSNAGGMGSHWTCATPTPGFGEIVTLIPETELAAAFETARSLLEVTTHAFDDSPLGAEVRDLLASTYDAGRTEDRRVQPMPLAVSMRADGSHTWTGPDVILDDLVTTGRPGFELRMETVALQIEMDGSTATSVLLHDRRGGDRSRVDVGVIVVAGDAFRTPQLLDASGIRPPALGHYLNDQPQVTGTVRLHDRFIPDEARTHRTESGAIDVLSGVSWIPFDIDRFPFHGQIMQRDASPVPVDDGSETWPGSIVECGLFAAKDIRWEDYLEFDHDHLDYFGLPSIKIHYNLTTHDRAGIDRMISEIEDMAELLGELVNGTKPFHFPNGSSIHYQGTVRMGADDDGTSVCDPHSRVWGTDNVYVGGNGVIPTPTACNPTLTSVAHAVLAATQIASQFGTTRTNRAQDDEKGMS